MGSNHKTDQICLITAETVVHFCAFNHSCMALEGKWTVCNAGETGNTLHVLTRTTHIEF